MKSKLLSPLVIFLFLGSCETIKVTSDYDKTVDFTKIKTYSYLGWAEESNKILNRFDQERIEKAFADEFGKRGMTYVERGADVAVSLFIVVDQKTSVTSYTNHYGGMGPVGYRYGYGGWGWGMGHSTTSYNEEDYLVGTLVCDVFDNESKNLIWQGVGTGTVDDDPQTRDKNIPKAVAKIMTAYPVQIP